MMKLLIEGVPVTVTGLTAETDDANMADRLEAFFLMESGEGHGPSVPDIEEPILTALQNTFPSVILLEKVPNYTPVPDEVY